jgi:hypothetical protein
MSASSCNNIMFQCRSLVFVKKTAYGKDVTAGLNREINVKRNLFSNMSSDLHLIQVGQSVYFVCTKSNA